VTIDSAGAAAPRPGTPGADVRDEADPRPVLASQDLVSGMVWDVRRDTVDLRDGQVVVRDLVLHTGAVGVLVMDEQDRVLLIRQYRHPVGMLMWEPVAGLLDLPGEDPLTAARRELVEEAGLLARRWDVLVDYEPSPGGSSEALRVYLAREVALAPGGRPAGEGEERDLPQAWVPLDQARDRVLSGDLTAPITVVGVLAAVCARAGGWASLRPARTPWPVRESLLAHGRVRGH
jgi:ADP-ribose pyrophosphatase